MSWKFLIGQKGEFEVGLIEKHNVLTDFKRILLEDSQEQQVHNLASFLMCQTAAIATIGKIGCSTRGLMLLDADGILPTYLSFVNNEADLRLCFLRSCAFLLKTIAQ